MLFIADIQYPIKDPVTVFAIVLFVIFLAPLILQKIKIPGIIGIILAGTALGPTGFQVLERSFAIELFGTVGLLYIMFQAGLEVDMNDFRKTRNKSMIFGILTFIFPQVFGTLGSVYLLGLNWPSAILLASMFASHTLISYPIVSRLDLTKNEAVTIAIGGTLIVNVLALLVLAVIAGAAEGELNTQFWVNFGISLSIFVFAVLWVGPRVVRWFFRNVQNDGVSHYIFVLAFAFAASFGAQIAGIESIIGAFLAGLAVNNLISPTSSLMNRIDFVGAALFIPFFLINVGMLADLRILFAGRESLIAVGIITAMAVILKWIPARLTAYFFRYRPEEEKLIFGLSVAQAASTLAAALVGYRLNLVDDTVLNGIIIMILVTCIISSLVTESAGKKLAISEAEKAPEKPEVEDRILVPISNPKTIIPLIDLAIAVKDPKSKNVIHSLSIINDDDAAQEQIAATRKKLEKAVKYAAAAEVKLDTLMRVDHHTGEGIARVVKELMANRIIIGWHGKYNPKDYLFGTVLDYLLANVPQLIMVTYLLHPLNVTKKIVVTVPNNIELEPGFRDTIETLRILTTQTGSNLHFIGPQSALSEIDIILQKAKPTVEAVYEHFEDWDDFPVLRSKVTPEDLFVTIKAREGTLPFAGYMNRVPRFLSKYFQEISFIILFPEQKIE